MVALFEDCDDVSDGGIHHFASLPKTIMKKSSSMQGRRPMGKRGSAVPSGMWL